MKSKWLKILAVTACLTLAAGLGVACKGDKSGGTQYQFNDPENGQVVYTTYDTKLPVTEDVGYVLKKYSGSGSVVIPSEYNGKPVVAIADKAFADCTGVTSVVIPDSVMTIGDEAFYNCSSLSSVTIGENVTKIGVGAFGACTSLTEIDIPASVTDNVSESVKTYGGGWFYNCDKLTEIRVHEDNEDYQSIDGNLYSKNGKRLVQYAIGKQETSFTIPNKVTNIDRFAFGGNDYLTEVIMPNTVTSVYDGAFYRCSKLENVQLSTGLSTIVRWMFYECDSLKGIKLPEKLTAIGERSFYGCDSLTEIDIPGNYKAGLPNTSLEEAAFLNCVNLKKVTLRDGVKLIGTQVFQDCTSLAEINIPDTVENIKIRAFEKCKSLTEITIPKSVKWIAVDGNSVFADCYKLTINCEVSPGVDTADWKSGWNKVGPKEVWNEKKQTYETVEYFCPIVWDCNNNAVADDGCMYKVVDGVRYKVKDGVAVVAEQGLNLEEANIAETIECGGKTYNVTGIEENAFYDCGKLTKVVIPQSIEKIGPWAFFGCYELTIYCAAETQPESWGDTWNLSNAPVVWGYNGED